MMFIMSVAARVLPYGVRLPFIQRVLGPDLDPDLVR